MMFSSCKTDITRIVPMIKFQIACTDKSELDEEYIISRLLQFK